VKDCEAVGEREENLLNFFHPEGCTSQFWNKIKEQNLATFDEQCGFYFNESLVCCHSNFT